MIFRSVSVLIFNNCLIIKVPHQGYQYACPHCHYHCQQIVVAPSFIVFSHFGPPPLLSSCVLLPFTTRGGWGYSAG